MSRINEIMAEQVDKLKDSVETHPLLDGNMIEKITECICAQLQSILAEYKNFNQVLEEVRAVLPPGDYKIMMDELGLKEEDV